MDDVRLVDRPRDSIESSAAMTTTTTTTTTTTALASSLVVSRLAASKPLLPESAATWVTAVSLATRVSLRAAALIVEAILESGRCSTSTGLGLTRRALVSAVNSARHLHYLTSLVTTTATIPATTDHPTPSDPFLKVLHAYSNLGVYLVRPFGLIHRSPRSHRPRILINERRTDPF